MELGCFDLVCVSSSDEILTTESAEARNGETATTKIGKNKSPKGSPPSGVNALNRFTCQIKKPPHRKTSPLNWFPRKKVDSYLMRKIKLLQEAGGMNDTLDQTLGHSNPHYCRVERDKIAAREAACKVMEARKAAMVEASWCRILQAARIPSKEAEDLLLKAEKEVAEAFEGATAKGVIMYDTPDRPLKHFEIETSSVSGKGSTTHTVKASFETAFEVDKQVAAAVKTAFIRLAHCSSFSKDEFKDLSRKISENPDNQELSESDIGSELERGPREDDFSAQKRHRKKLSPQKFNGSKLVDMMLGRLKCLKEDELASLATIAATCGLNAALADIESNNNRVQDKIPSVAGIRTNSSDYFTNGAMRQKQFEQELPSLDKFLVKKMTKLEKEVQEARNARKAESTKSGEVIHDESQPYNDNVEDKAISADDVPDLGSLLVKHCSKLEKEIEEAKRNQGKLSKMDGTRLGRTPQNGKSRQPKQEDPEVPSLDKFLVKYKSRLEREVWEAKNRRRNIHEIPEEQGHSTSSSSSEKENVDLNRSLPLQPYKKGNEDGSAGQENSLEKILVKQVHRLEREKMQAISERKESGNWGYKKQQGKIMNDTENESLDKVLVKHVSRLQKEKMGHGTNEVLELKKKDKNFHSETSVGGLDQILVKHKSRLQRDKTSDSKQPKEGYTTYSVSRREARERELLEMWGGIGLGNSMRPHVSRLERDKAAWLKADEEERREAALQEQ